ncbi:MarC family NAAT transporter [Zhouia sp. PK063]|uniref:MarC family NAAT transporter n=1 Tax=Zhouia sp. PK063 TaxID=3373602 RepID=UPI0037B28425
MELFLFTFAALFSVINPLGTLPIFVGLTQDDDLKSRKRAAFFTALNTFIILIISFFTGKYILSFFGISINSLRIAGGLIIVSSGFALLSGNFAKHKGLDKRVKDDAFQRDDVSLTPLAIPMLAGPGTISLLISYYESYHNSLQIITVVSALLVVCFIVFIMLRSAHFIVKWLGASGINAVSRIIGFIIIAIGIEYICGAVMTILGKI